MSLISISKIGLSFQNASKQGCSGTSV